MEPVQPTQEHAWLMKLVGEWTCDSECIMGPDQPPSVSKGLESVRSFGGLWTIGDGTMLDDKGGPAMHSIMTLGYDPAKKRFTGSFIATCMTHFWTYDGTLDNNKLILDAEGPAWDGTGMAKYQDCIDFVNDDVRILTSRLLTKEGTWMQFMKATYTRKK